MVVTKTETGNPGARDKIRPPTAATSAKMTDHSTVCSGEEVICTAAAPGVISKAMTNSAPTICTDCAAARPTSTAKSTRSEEHTSELQSRGHLVCRLLLEKKKHNTK